MSEPEMPKFNQLLRRAINVSTRFKSARQLAQAAGLSEAAIGQYLREDDPKLPGYETIVRLCHALGTHPNRLMGFTDPATAIWRDRYMRFQAPLAQLIDAYREDLNDQRSPE